MRTWSTEQMGDGEEENRRVAAVALFDTGYRDACPPGVDPVRFGRAMAEDVLDLLASLSRVDTVVVAGPPSMDDAKAVVSPGMTIVEATTAGAAFTALGELGYVEAALVAADVPDLPALLAAKPFSGLSTADVAVVPDRVAGLAVLASRLPVPSWLPYTVDLATPDALARLRSAAPAGASLAVAPSWRRLRAPADVAGLDPALEGWEFTRALLSGW
jgi:2-phospho-L-lactate guanylyltransferase (CobY/MobA/RfbA family)